MNEDTWTPQDYRAAASILQGHYEPDERGDVTLHIESAASYLRGIADEKEAQEEYAEDIAALFSPRDLPLLNGARVLKKLFEDGWTPPEGLLYG